MIDQEVNSTTAKEQQLQQNGEVGYYLRYLIGKQILKKYTTKMISLIRSRMYQKMTKQQFIILNDQSHYIEDLENKKLIQPWRKQQQKLKKKKPNHPFNFELNIPLFSMDNKLVFALSGIDMILFFILGFYFSTMFCFTIFQKIPQYINNMIILYILVQIIQMVIQLNTGFYSQGQYISSRKNILKNCLQSYTFYSRVSITSIFANIVVTNHQSSLFILIIFAHSYTIFNFLSKLQEKVIQFQILKKIISMIVLLNYAFYIAHIASLVWVSVGVYETESQSKSWIIQFLKIDDTDIEQNKFLIYIASIHYIIVTMVTVGYGDIFPTTSTERLFNILIMIISSFVFAYIVNAVGQILSEIHNQRREVEHKQYIIKAYMKKKNVTIELQQQILQYLHYVSIQIESFQYWRKSQNSKCKEEQFIIHELSDELKQTLLMEANKLIVQESIIFNQNFSEPFLQKVVQHIQEINLCPQQLIFSAGDKDSSAIYFIEEGSVEKFISLNEGKSQITKGVHIIQTIEKGMYFGVQEFFTGQKRQFNVRCKDFCTLLCIQRQDFLNLLRDFNDDFERFCDIRDTLLFTKGQNSILLKCSSCKELNHLVEACPFLHYIPDKQKIMQMNGYNYQELQRGNHNRKKNKTIYSNTYNIIFEVQTDQQKLLEEQFDNIQIYLHEYIQYDEEEDDDDEEEDPNCGDGKEDKKVQQINTPLNKDDHMILSMSQSIDQYENFERFRQSRDHTNLFSQGQIKHSYSGQFYDNLEEQLIKHKKSNFVYQQPPNSSVLAPETPSINRAKSRSNQNINFNYSEVDIMNNISHINNNNNFNDAVLQQQNYNNNSNIIQVPSTSELSSHQNIGSQNENQFLQKERKNSIYSLKQIIPNPQNNHNGYTPQISVNSTSQNKKKEQYKKRNSNETNKITTFNKPIVARSSQKKNTNKTLFLQVEQQIQKLHEQFIQSQLHQKIFLQQDDFLTSFEVQKSFQNYKSYYNVEEVLKRYRKLQIQKLSTNISNNFKQSILDQLNEDESEGKQKFGETRKLRQSLGFKSKGKLIEKKQHQSTELENYSKQDSKTSNQKKQLFADFIYKLQGSCLIVDQSSMNNTKNKIENNLNNDIQSPPFLLQSVVAEEKQNKVEDFLLDSSKSSIYSLKYLPQFKNFETQQKDKYHENKEISIDDQIRITNDLS